jgi:hypothetical protein
MMIATIILMHFYFIFNTKNEYDSEINHVEYINCFNELALN